MVHIDFGIGMVRDAQDLESRIRLSLSRTANKYGISGIEHPNPRDFLEELLLRMEEKHRQKVAVLIDE